MTGLYFMQEAHGHRFLFARGNNMILEFLILKITLEGVLKHCNQIAQEKIINDQMRWLKTRLVQLRADYENGLISEQTYKKNEDEIITALQNIKNYT